MEKKQSKIRNFNPKDLKFCPYEVLQIDKSNLNEIPKHRLKKMVVSAYRKLSLKYHPDRHPNDPQKHSLFIQLKQASEILLDDEALSKYDSHLLSKQMEQKRIQKLDSKRQWMIQELKRRENEQNVEIVPKQTKQLSELEKIIQLTKKAEKEEQELLFNQIIKEKQNKQFYQNIEQKNELQQNQLNKGSYFGQNILQLKLKQDYKNRMRFTHGILLKLLNNFGHVKYLVDVKEDGLKWIVQFENEETFVKFFKDIQQDQSLFNISDSFKQYFKIKKLDKQFEFENFKTAKHQQTQWSQLFKINN